MDRRVANWLISRDTGRSSLAIVAKMNGADVGKLWHPYDPDDLGRCIRLLDLIPEYRARLDEMHFASIEWSVLVNHWDELERLYREEAPDRSAPRCYARMRELLDPLMRQPAERSQPDDAPTVRMDAVDDDGRPGSIPF